MPYELEWFHGLEIINQAKSEIHHPQLHIERKVSAVERTARHTIRNLGNEFDTIGHLEGASNTAE